MSDEINPYNQRDHDTVPMDQNDIRAVAGLLGQVSGSLKEIDKRNVGGNSQWIQANKIDPRQVLRGMTGETQVTPQPTQVTPQPTQQITTPVQSQPTPQAVIPPQSQNISNDEIEQLNKRVLDLERTLETYKNIVKFKRGISYTINTSKISGQFKDPGVILDLISTEMAKNTKVITLKLNDETKGK